MGHKNCKHPEKHGKTAEAPAMAPLPKPKALAARIRAVLTGE